jgi:hypothetical protein
MEINEVTLEKLNEVNVSKLTWEHRKVSLFVLLTIRIIPE